MSILIPMVDCGIFDVDCKLEDYPGCETCDYGSCYTNDFTIKMVHGDIRVLVDNMYDYAISQDYLMKLFLPNIDKIKLMKEKEFFNWIKEKVEKVVDADEVEVTFIVKEYNND